MASPFFSGHAAKALIRTFPMAPRKLSGALLSVDASPWGFGGVLTVGGEVTAWLAEPLQTDDLRRLRALPGGAAHVTTWKAIALLAAAKAWLPAFRGEVVAGRNPSARSAPR